MPKILFLTLHRPSRSPSQRFRFEQYIPYLEANGFRCYWSFLLNQKDDKEYYKHGNIISKADILIRSWNKRYKEIKRIEKYDLLFIQRECFMLGTSFFERQFSKHSKIIYDFDDAIWLKNVSEANKQFSFLKNPDKIASIIKISQLVIAGNKYLASYAKNFNNNVKVIPTTIDTSNHHAARKKHKNKHTIVIGWTGSNTTLKYLFLLNDTIKKLNKDKKIEFVVISDKKPNLDWMNLKFIPWNKKTEIEDLLRIDIGVMPIPNTKWAKGKCGFKILQYQALGIPPIASPIGVNSAIIQDGENGFLANTTEEWVEKISLLIEDAELRNKMGKKGRQTVEEKYSVEG